MHGISHSSANSTAATRPTREEHLKRRCCRPLPGQSDDWPTFILYQSLPYLQHDKRTDRNGPKTNAARMSAGTIARSPFESSTGVFESAPKFRQPSSEFCCISRNVIDLPDSPAMPCRAIMRSLTMSNAQSFYDCVIRAERYPWEKSANRPDECASVAARRIRTVCVPAPGHAIGPARNTNVRVFHSAANRFRGLCNSYPVRVMQEMREQFRQCSGGQRNLQETTSH